MTDAKKITKSAFATKNWIRNMKHLANITSNATDSEKAHAKAVVSFMMNTFIHIFEHIIEMAVAGFNEHDLDIEVADGKLIINGNKDVK